MFRRPVFAIMIGSCFLTEIVPIKKIIFIEVM
jgi:hypothetical protein